MAESRRRRPDEEKRQPRSQPERTRSRAREHDDAERRDAAPRSRPSPGIAALVRSAREQLTELIGRPISGMLGFERQDDCWMLTLEVVELERIPETTSVLGCYRALVSDDGDVLEYRRIRRYNRSQPDEDPG